MRERQVWAGCIGSGRRACFGATSAICASRWVALGRAVGLSGRFCRLLRMLCRRRVRPLPALRVRFCIRKAKSVTAR